jgi:hypothetical protein
MLKSTVGVFLPLAGGLDHTVEADEFTQNETHSANSFLFVIGLIR